jgi:hypothetical protein
VNRADARVVELTRILCALRTAAGLAPDYRGCLLTAFAATDGELEHLHRALGELIEVAAKSTEAR